MKNYLLLAGIFMMVIGFTGCSDDDDLSEVPAKGMIQANETALLSGNILTVERVVVGQASWLAAVPDGEENTNNFIAQPVVVPQGTTSNVKLYFDDDALNSPNEQQVVLKLYADNQNSGTPGEWDPLDEPIRLGNNELVMKTITIYPDLTNFKWFEYFDSNENGTLEVEEILISYPSPFDFYDKDQITPDEFLLMTYYSTDTDADAGISEAEWKAGHLKMYSNWAVDNFANFDLDKNGLLDLEEWHETFEESEWFETYDANSDSQLTEEELNNGFFADWDLNNDGKIDGDEFNNYWPFASSIKFTAPVWEW